MVSARTNPGIGTPKSLTVKSKEGSKQEVALFIRVVFKRPIEKDLE